MAQQQLGLGHLEKATLRYPTPSLALK
jgi:hypothetical protein